MGMIKKFLSRFIAVEEGDLCMICKGEGFITIHKRPDRQPDPLDKNHTCPHCRGKGLLPFRKDHYEPRFTA